MTKLELRYDTNNYDLVLCSDCPVYLLEVGTVEFC